MQLDFLSIDEQLHRLHASEACADRHSLEQFTERFDATTTTERIDRIAWARERDLRHNQYLAWRVR